MLVFPSKARKPAKLNASFKIFLSFTLLCAFEKSPKIWTWFFTLMLVFPSKARKPAKLNASFENFLSFTRLCAFEKSPKIWTWVFYFDVSFSKFGHDFLTSMLISMKSAQTPKMKCKLQEFFQFYVSLRFWSKSKNLDTSFLLWC